MLLAEQFFAAQTPEKGLRGLGPSRRGSHGGADGPLSRGKTGLIGRGTDAHCRGIVVHPQVREGREDSGIETIGLRGNEVQCLGKARFDPVAKEKIEVEPALVQVEPVGKASAVANGEVAHLLGVAVDLGEKNEAVKGFT